MDESTSFEMIDRIIQESIRPVLKADGGDITLIDFSDGVVKIALEKTRVPVTFSNFLVTFKVRTGCSLVPHDLKSRVLVHKLWHRLEFHSHTIRVDKCHRIGLIAEMVSVVACFSGSPPGKVIHQVAHGRSVCRSCGTLVCEWFQRPPPSALHISRNSRSRISR